MRRPRPGEHRRLWCSRPVYKPTLDARKQNDEKVERARKVGLKWSKLVGRRKSKRFDVHTESEFKCVSDYCCVLSACEMLLVEREKARKIKRDHDSWLAAYLLACSSFLTRSVRVMRCAALYASHTTSNVVCILLLACLLRELRKKKKERGRIEFLSLSRSETIAEEAKFERREREKKTRAFCSAFSLFIHLLSTVLLRTIKALV